MNPLTGAITDEQCILFDPPTQDVDQYLDGLNAAYFYKRWHIAGGSVQGIKIPCTPIRYRGPFSIEPVSWEAKLGMHACQDLNPAECARARKVMATWLVDFEWTMGQQRVGAEFGIEKCRQASPKSFVMEKCDETGTPAPARAHAPVSGDAR